MSYVIFGGIGLVVGFIVGAVAAAGVYNDPNCYGVDFFGNVSFICEDPTFTFAGGGLLLGLVAAYFTARR